MFPNKNILVGGTVDLVIQSLDAFSLQSPLQSVPSWSTNNSNVTLVVASNGLSAVATGAIAGSTTITVTALGVNGNLLTDSVIVNVSTGYATSFDVAFTALNNQMIKGETKVITLSPVDDSLVAAPFNGVPTWTLDVPSGLYLDVDLDGESANVTANIAGTYVITITGVGASNAVLTEEVEVTVSNNYASSLNINFG